MRFRAGESPYTLKVMPICSTALGVVLVAQQGGHPTGSRWYHQQADVRPRRADRLEIRHRSFRSDTREPQDVLQCTKIQTMLANPSAKGNRRFMARIRISMGAYGDLKGSFMPFHRRRSRIDYTVPRSLESQTPSRIRLPQRLCNRNRARIESAIRRIP